MIELDRHIEILLLSNDCVIIPNFGGFMAHYVEARKDERDNAFLPPMRTIGFNPKLTLNDSLLAQSYVEVYDISYPDAVSRIEDEVRELKQHLANDERYEMNSIGVLKLTSNGNYEFEPCSAGILTPSLYGLGYYECKSLAQIERELLSETPTASSLEPFSPLQTEEPAVSATLAEDSIDEPAKDNKVVSLWRNIAVACAAFILFLLIPTPLANNNTKLVQGKVNTKLLDYVLPKEVTTGEKQVEHNVKAAQLATAPIKKNNNNNSNAIQGKTGYTLVMASKISHKNANAYAAELHKKGFADAEVYTKNKSTRVVYGTYASQDAAYRALKSLQQHKVFAEAWVMKY